MVLKVDIILNPAHVALHPLFRGSFKGGEGGKRGQTGKFSKMRSGRNLKE